MKSATASKLEDESVQVVEQEVSSNVNKNKSKFNFKAIKVGLNKVEGCFSENIKRRIIFVGLFITVFLSALDQTIVTVALSAISAQFTDNASSATWIGSAFTLSQAAIIPFCGKAAETWGRKLVILSALLFFCLGCVLCGSSQSMIMLVISRAIQGIGAGAMNSSVFMIITDISTPQEQGSVQGYIGATWGVAAAIGPLIGGIFSQYTTWRWCFFVNVPISMIPITIFTVLYHSKTPEVSFKQTLVKFDYFGLVTLMSGVILILLSFEWGGQSKLWSSASVLCCLCIGVVLLLCFVMVELKFSQDPLIPLAILNSKTRSSSYFASFLHSMTYGGLSYYMPYYFQGAQSKSQIMSGVCMLPMVVGFAFVSFLSGRLISWMKSYKYLIMGGYFFATIFLGLLTLLKVHSGPGLYVPLFLFVGLSLGPNFNSPLIPIRFSCQGDQKQLIGLAASLYALIRSLGSSIGISVGSMIITSSLKKGSQEVAGLSMFQGIELIHNSIGTVKLELQQEYSTAIKLCMIFLTAAMGAGLCSSLFIGEIRPEDVDKKVQDKTTSESSLSESELSETLVKKEDDSQV